jgi:DNA-binding beta-propeller fold protein YncE
MLKQPAKQVILPFLLAQISDLHLSALGATEFSFKLNNSYTTSAGVFRSNGTLVKTLWRKKEFRLGNHRASWDNTDDSGKTVPQDNYQVRLLYHNTRYVWDGVIGNSSTASTGLGVHRAFFPPSSIAIAGNNAFYTANYNEGQSGFHGFNTQNPQQHLSRLDRKDPFSAYSMVATDGVRAYWTNVGGLVHDTFVVATKVSDNKPATFSAGLHTCLNFFPGSVPPKCYLDQDWPSVIDNTKAPGDRPLGIAVQPQGNILAVAHGTSNQIKLFNKTSGAFLSAIPVKFDDKINRIAMAPNGDLWVIASDVVLCYSHLSQKPLVIAALRGLSNPLAIAVHPQNNDLVMVVDGGKSQQVKAFDSKGRPLWTLGKAGGYGSEPNITNDRFAFRTQPGGDQSAIAIQSDGSFWVIDTNNLRMMHFSAQRKYLEAISYLPHSYVATVDPNHPSRVFSNFMEFAIDYAKPLSPVNGSWRLVKNWSNGLVGPYASVDHGGFGGFKTVITLANKRTYGLIAIAGGNGVVELPAQGPLRSTGIVLPPDRVLYADGSLGYATTEGGTQKIFLKPLTGFDELGNPRWGEAKRIQTFPAGAGDPFYRGAFSGLTGPRFPITASGIVVSFDQSVRGNTGFHLGGGKLGSTQWLWKASPTGWLDGLGSFQTAEIDGTVNYGGNMVWAQDRNIVYGFHGEFATDRETKFIDQPDQFMHFYDDGLFVGQFGLPSAKKKQEADVGQSGNAFSWALVSVGKQLYLYNNDESSHAGVHRWRIEGADGIRELTGVGQLNTVITLR